MKILGQVAQLSRRESKLFDCDPEPLIARLNCDRALGTLALRADNLSTHRPSNGLEAARAAISLVRLCLDENAVIGVAGEVLAHETALYLEYEHRPE